MESYQRIMSLVEDVRDILDLHEAKKKKGKKGKKGKKVSAMTKADLKKMMGKPSKAMADEKTKDANIAKGHAGPTKHNPFKNIGKGKHLGPTHSSVAKKRGPSTTTPGTRRGKWRCRCHGYKCLCTGKSEATGKQISKTVRIGRIYKQGYNARYKAWREKHAKQYAPGGKRGFKKPAKPHHKHYHAD